MNLIDYLANITWTTWVQEVLLYTLLISEPCLRSRINPAVQDGGSIGVHLDSLPLSIEQACNIKHPVILINHLKATEIRCCLWKSEINLNICPFKILTTGCPKVDVSPLIPYKSGISRCIRKSCESTIQRDLGFFVLTCLLQWHTEKCKFVRAVC